MKTTSICAVLLLGSLCFPSYSRAQLLGDTITGTGNGLTPASATIGGGVEFTIQGISFTVANFDFGASTLTLTTGAPNTGGISNGGNFVFSGFDTAITGISVGTNQGWSGTVLTPTFTAGSITVNLDSAQIAISAPAPRALVYNIQTGSSVPDTGGTVGILGGALAGLLVLRRRSG